MEFTLCRSVRPATMLPCMCQSATGPAHTSMASETCRGGWQQKQPTFPDLPGIANDMPSEKPYMRVASTTWIDNMFKVCTRPASARATKQLIYQVPRSVEKVRCAFPLMGKPFGSSCGSPETSSTCTLQGLPTCKQQSSPVSHW